MSNNNFASLADLALHVCNNPDKPPSQWIYAVDDAWLHNGCEGLLDGPLFVGCTEPKKISIDAAKSLFEKDRQDESMDSPELSSTKTEEASEEREKRHPDQTPAETLLELIKERKEQNYGICFCTFEYFWNNAKEINLPQNAVFFDIRHQLMENDEKSDLKTEWDSHLSKTNVFSNTSWDVLGIQVYFAFKLGLHPAAGKCKIDHNHLLILSSNLFGNEDGNGKTDEERNNVLRSFSDIQSTIWSKAAEVKKRTAEENGYDSKLASLLDLDGTDFTFIPMPKHTAGNLFETALAIFHNSFRKAAGWEFKLNRLRQDMESLWAEPEPQEDWGHVGQSSPKLSGLKSSSWLPANLIQKHQDVRGIYLVQWRIEHGILVSTFDNFLRYMVDFGTVKFFDLPQNLKARRIELPTRPGLLGILAIAEFLRALAAAKPDVGEVQPRLSWDVDNEIRLEIQLENAEQHVENLAEKFFHNTAGSTGGSAATLRQYVNSQLKMLNYPLKKEQTTIMLGDIAYNGQSVRDRVLRTKEYHKVHNQRTFPQFDQDKIIFWFKTAATPQLGV